MDDEQRMFTERVLKGEFDNLPEDAPKGTLRFHGFMGGMQHEQPPNEAEGQGKGDDAEYNRLLEQEVDAAAKEMGVSGRAKANKDEL